MKAKLIPEYREKRMHIDGLQEISVVNGMRVHLERDLGLGNQTVVTNMKHRSLAPAAPAATV